MKGSSEEPVWANGRLRLLLSAACNINCFYCHNEGMPKYARQFSDGLLEHVIRLIEAQPPTQITFTGGEPLLHPRLEVFATRLKRLCHSLTVVTNGLLLTAEMMQKLKDAGISKFRLGADSLFGEKSRPSSGAYPCIRIMDVIEMVLASGVSLELNIVLTKFNLGEIPAILRFCAATTLSAKVFEHVEIRSFGTYAAPAQIRAAPVVSFNEFSDIVNTSGVPLQIDEIPGFKGANFILQGDHFSWRYCRYLCPFSLCYMTGTRIDPDGLVYACMEKRIVEVISEHDSLESSIAKIARIKLATCGRTLDE